MSLSTLLPSAGALFAAAVKEEVVRLAPPVRMTLERAPAWVEDDELVEVTPKAIRSSKLDLDPNERKRFEKQRLCGAA
jgi:GTP-binding protein